MRSHRSQISRVRNYLPLVLCALSALSCIDGVEPIDFADVLINVSSSEGVPIGKALTILLDQDEQIERAITDKDGSVRFRDIPSGEYVIEVTAEGFEQVRKVVRVPRSGQVHVEIVVGRSI